MASFSAVATLLLAAIPAQAHGSAGAGLAGGGLAGGLMHPLMGLDHLLMLLAVGAVGAFISPALLGWALGGALVGGMVGSSLASFGLNLPAGELLAALAIVALGIVIFASAKGRSITFTPALVALGVSFHSMLHGLEVPQDGSSLGWWMGALAASALVAGCSYGVCKYFANRGITRLAIPVAVGFTLSGVILSGLALASGGI
ncbi:HupE/UreJ family protein [Cyanobium sp. WAJ14-Wanaka]|uniref:HupE/UreJ family protein n=1 Tax=Cyanobium sp. WAJ14-Wanaka TaxID=2823725 RepID=UPI0020CCADD8|nr:HupE/UreJ family protein [Cyanobium sp. WAJ14-Wanaka]MCP9774296.1 HupE/UreJ family protein [Cyanobium sp. WAJ14-Wanaka]